MLSSKLIQLIESHYERIATRIERRIRQEATALGLGVYPETELRLECREILCKIGDLLVTKHTELADHYERVGRRGFENDIPLHEMVHAFQIIHEEMVQYARDQGLADTTVEMYAEEELERAADHLFDTIIFYVVRGYVHAMRNRTITAAGGHGPAF